MTAILALMGRSSTAGRTEIDDADGGAGDLGAGAGDLDVAQRLPALDEVPRPAREHAARLAERDREAAVVEVAEVVDRAVAGAMHRFERRFAPVARIGAIDRVGAAVGRKAHRRDVAN